MKQFFSLIKQKINFFFFKVPQDRDENDENDDDKFFAFVSDLEEEEFYDDDDDNDDNRLLKMKEKKIQETALKIGSQLYYSGSRNLRKSRKRYHSDNDDDEEKSSNNSQYFPINDFLEFDLQSESSSKRMRFSSTSTSNNNNNNQSNDDQENQLNLEHLTLDQFNFNQLNSMNLDEIKQNQLSLEQLSLNKWNLNETNENEICESINNKSISSDGSCDCSLCLIHDDEKSRDASGSCDNTSSQNSLASRFSAPRLKQITLDDLLTETPKKKPRLRKKNKKLSNKKIQLTPDKHVYDMYGTRTINYEPNYNFINQIDPNGLEYSRLSDDTSDSSPKTIKIVKKKKKNCDNFLRRLENPNLSETNSSNAETSSEFEENSSPNIKRLTIIVERLSNNDNDNDNFQIKPKKKSYREILGERQLYINLERLDTKRIEFLKKQLTKLKRSPSNLSEFNTNSDSNSSQRLRRSCRTKASYRELTESDYSDTTESKSSINSRRKSNLTPRNKKTKLINKKLNFSIKKSNSNLDTNKFNLTKNKNTLRRKLSSSSSIDILPISHDIWFIDDSQPMKIRLRKFRNSDSISTPSLGDSNLTRHFQIEKEENSPHYENIEKIDFENSQNSKNLTSIEKNLKENNFHLKLEDNSLQIITEENNEIENPFKENLEFILNVQSRINLNDSKFNQTKNVENKNIQLTLIDREETTRNEELANIEAYKASNKIIELMNFDENSQNANADVFDTSISTTSSQKINDFTDNYHIFIQQLSQENNEYSIKENQLEEENSQFFPNDNNYSSKNLIKNYKQSMGFCPIEDSENSLYDNNQLSEIKKEYLAKISNNQEILIDNCYSILDKEIVNANFSIENNFHDSMTKKIHINLNVENLENLSIENERNFSNQMEINENSQKLTIENQLDNNLENPMGELMEFLQIKNNEKSKFWNIFQTKENETTNSEENLENSSEKLKIYEENSEIFIENQEREKIVLLENVNNERENVELLNIEILPENEKIYLENQEILKNQFSTKQEENFKITKTHLENEIILENSKILNQENSDIQSAVEISKINLSPPKLEIQMENIKISKINHSPPELEIESKNSKIPNSSFQKSQIQQEENNEILKIQKIHENLKQQLSLNESIIQLKNEEKSLKNSSKFIVESEENSSSILLDLSSETEELSENSISDNDEEEKKSIHQFCSLTEKLKNSNENLKLNSSKISDDNCSSTTEKIVSPISSSIDFEDGKKNFIKIIFLSKMKINLISMLI